MSGIELLKTSESIFNSVGFTLIGHAGVRTKQASGDVVINAREIERAVTS